LVRRAGFSKGSDQIYPIDQIQAARKYIFFSLAAIEYLKLINWQPDILHANDWHTAQAVYQLAEKKKTDVFYKQTHSLLTIHNLPFIGEGSQKVLKTFLQTAMPYSDDLPDWALDLPLPMGLKTADHILAVSPSYAQELKTPEFGNGLISFFNKHIKWH
jgi:starch synthase